jgi:predicted aspartyl protease
MRFMRPVFLILVIAGHWSNTLVWAQNTPVVTVPIVLNYDHIIIQLSLNGSEPLNFLFDSGAGGTLIAKNVADSLGFKSNVTRKNVGVSGEHKVGVIKGVKLAVGDEVLGNITALSTDMPFEEMDDGKKVHGIIGFPILSRYVVEVNYANDLLLFYNQNSYEYKGNGQAVPIEIQSNLPVAKANITMYNGVAIEGVFLIDTGARSDLIISSPTVVKYEMAENIGDYYTIRIKIGSSQKRIKLRYGRVQNLEFAGQNFSNVPVALSSESRGVLSMPELNGIIGNRLLKKFNIVFDYKENFIYLSPNENIINEPEINSSGFTIKFSGGKPFVNNVIDRSPASEAGLKNGDEIISVNGKLVDTMSATDLRASFRKIGDRIEIVIKRNKKLKYTEFTLKALI